MKRKHIILLIFIVWILSSTASAVIHEDTFYATLGGENYLLEDRSGGTGWENENGQQWLKYEDPTVPPTSDLYPWWWNQWFYDDYPVENRWKHIEYGVKITPEVFTLDYRMQVQIVVNWSTPDYSSGGPTNLPPQPGEEKYIIRKEVLPLTDLAENQPILLEGEFDIREYNPEWVSIDVWVYSWGVDDNGIEPIILPPDVMIDGWIIHECIPEPASLTLLGLGLLTLLKHKTV